jgi:hypothetical protein
MYVKAFKPVFHLLRKLKFLIPMVDFAPSHPMPVGRNTKYVIGSVGVVVSGIKFPSFS